MRPLAVGFALLLCVSPCSADDPTDPPKLDTPLAVRTVAKRWAYALAVSPDGKWVATGGDEGFVQVWKLPSLEPAPLRTYHTAAVEEKWFNATSVTALAFSPDGKRFAAGNWDGGLVVTGIAKEKPASIGGDDRYTFGGGWFIGTQEETITSIAFSPNGKRVASGSADDTLVIYDAKGPGRRLVIGQDNEYDVTCLAFSPDGKRIVTGDGDNNVSIWDTKSGERIASPGGHDEAVTCVAYPPDGKSIVTGSWDDTLVVRTAESGEVQSVLEGHAGDVTDVAYTPDGKTIVSADEFGVVRFWDARTGKTTTKLQAARGAVTALAVTPDGKHLATIGRNELKLWALPQPRKVPPNAP